MSEGITLELMGRGGSSSGSTLDYRSRGPEFDSHLEKRKKLPKTEIYSATSELVLVSTVGRPKFPFS